MTWDIPKLLFFLVCCLVLSQGPISGYVAWAMWKERKEFRASYYLGPVMGALTIMTGLSMYRLIHLMWNGLPRMVNGEVVYVTGLSALGSLHVVECIVIGSQALLSIVLWRLGLYYIGVLS